MADPKPLIVVVDPQAAELGIEQELCGEDIDFRIIETNATPPDPATYAVADVWINHRSKHRVTAQAIARMTRCRLIVNAGVGFDSIDIGFAASRGIPVCNVPDYGTTEVADHAIALLLTLARGTAAYNARLIAQGGWAAIVMPGIRRLRGLRFGVVGLGRIGTAAARRAEAFGLRPRFFDPLLPPGAELAHGYARHASLRALMADSDVVSLHTPLNDATRGMIDHAALAALPDGAILVNTSRGGVLDLAAVEAALRSGRLGAAGLDVLPDEPPAFTEPLLAAWRGQEGWLQNRLIITPHAAFYAPDSIADMERLSTLTAVEFLRHGTLRSCVNGVTPAAQSRAARQTS